MAPLPDANGVFNLRSPEAKWLLVYPDGSAKVSTIPTGLPTLLAQEGNTKTLLDQGGKTLWGEDVKPVIIAPKMR